jgi:hypothetical protein
MRRARARPRSAALEKLRLQRIEERYTLGATLRALMQRMIVRLMNISAHTQRLCQLFGWAVTLMKHPPPPPPDEKPIAAGLLPSVCALSSPLESTDVTP